MAVQPAQQYPLMVSSLKEMDCGLESNCELVFSCNGKHFRVLLSPRPCPGFDEDGIERQLLQKLDRAFQSSDQSQMDEAIEEIAEVVVITIQPIFRELAPIKENERSKKSLHMYLSPQTFDFQLATHEGRPIIVKREEREATSEPFKPRRLNSFDTSSLPSFHPLDVEVLGELKGNQILKVSINNRLSCCKVVDRYTEKSISRGLALLQSLLSANLPSIRVPKLVGIVRSDDKDVVAILLEYIQANQNTSTLNRVPVDSIERSRRQEWAFQIRHTLNQLHELGIIWGDGKADNVLIDEDDNAWIIDFGGSWTEGWVMSR